MGPELVLHVTMLGVMLAPLISQSKSFASQASCQCAYEDGPNSWGSDIPVGNQDRVPGSSLHPDSNPAVVAI